MSVTVPDAVALLASQTRESLTPDAAAKVPWPVTVAEQIQFRGDPSSPMLSRRRAPDSTTQSAPATTLVFLSPQRSSPALPAGT